MRGRLWVVKADGEKPGSDGAQEEEGKKEIE